ncbi:C-4 methylsterol oxidase [Malassezia pachydermatis]|uniref:Fatty acid hydroxylase n=1 Tax=Malassezia pachydermatis TaxID=77020 RepID=A0A0M8MN16_9BASI|nr:fatty acid hydroxylase [Malassezia pachydermatis]KOS14868.1 fatty acid hydroxylase [Malassezia pachydermatis]
MYPKPHSDDWVNQKGLPLAHRMIKLFHVLPPAADEVKQTKLTDRMIVFKEWNQALFLYPFALLPFAVRYFYYHYVSTEMPSYMTMWIIMTVYTLNFGLYWVHFLKHLSRKYGYFNGAHGRDTIPFSEAHKVLFEVLSGLTIRPGLVVMCAYDPKTPPSLSLWFPLQLFVFTLVEDFFYYWAHRICHESEFSWKLHRQHHTTKYPTMLLLGYAGELQEVFDIFGAPFLTYLTFPISFDVFIIWMLIHVSIQIHGHSGVRLHHGTVLTGPFLVPLGLELVSEDHDLHHRHGWRESYNYGKQSGVWDTLFGTKGDRIEGYSENLDWNQFVY